MRPLDPLPSIKLKLGVLIVAAVGVTVVLIFAGFRAGLALWLTIPAAIALGLGMVQFLARGMTSPLRDMAAAATAMAKGDYARRVQATSNDEVGRLARAFNAMAGELAEVDRMRRDLVANVSHELRTPISALQAGLENMVDGVEPAHPDTLRTMLQQVERLGRLVTQLLDLSRLESGAVPLQVRPFDLSSVLDQAASEARLHAPATQIDVVIEPGLPSVLGDPERIHQVVANLVDNAVRHSPPSGTVRLLARSAKSQRVTIEVTDEGPGIPLEERSRVFERFYRADAARARPHGDGHAADSGSGLGLAIAKWIVDLHDGDIRVEDVPDGGKVAGGPSDSGGSSHARQSGRPSHARHPSDPADTCRRTDASDPTDARDCSDRSDRSDSSDARHRTDAGDPTGARHRTDASDASNPSDPSGGVARQTARTPGCRMVVELPAGGHR